MRRPIMTVDGGAQALERTMTVTLADGNDQVSVTVPDVLGALVFKGAAAMTDRRDNARHLHDGALLASLVTDYEGQRFRLHGHDRRRLEYLADQLKDSYHPAWAALPTGLARRGQDALRFLSLPPTQSRAGRRQPPTMPPSSPTPRREPPTIGL
jgi:hypothetical protein